MAKLEVMCIRTRRAGLLDPNGHIEAIGGTGGLIGTTTTWIRSEADAIHDIENGINEYYTKAEGQCARVRVAQMPDGRKYLTTEPDDTRQNNLLNLPQCPP